MGFFELFMIGIGLSMDAFAVAICKGLGMKRINYAHAFIIALFFGGFQALMPLVGWALGSQFEQLISPIDHWIAFALLAFLGGKMIYESVKGAGGENDAEGSSSAGEGVSDTASNSDSDPYPYSDPDSEGELIEDNDAARAGQHSTAAATASKAQDKLDMKELLMMAIATSIDALAVGITFAFLGVNIWFAITVIGITTFVLSLIGVMIGNHFGASYERPASLIGGIVLIFIGLKILFEHLGIV